MSAFTIPTDLVAPIFNPATFGNRALVEDIFGRLRAEYPIVSLDVV